MNLEHFKQVLDYIKTHPEKWNQKYWNPLSAREHDECGTAYCIAGHAQRMYLNSVMPSAKLTRSPYVTILHAYKFLEISAAADGSYPWLFSGLRTMADFEEVAVGRLDEYGKHIIQFLPDEQADFEPEWNQTVPESQEAKELVEA